MQKLKLLLLLTVLVLTASSQSIKPDSGISLPASDKVLFNQVAALYDNCNAQNSILQQQVDDCSQYQQVSANTIISADSVINALQKQLTDQDSISAIRYREMGNLTQVVKDTRKIATRKTIGWAVGGFSFGVATTTILFLIKHW